MTSDLLPSLLAGGGIGGALITLLVVLIRQVTANGRTNADQTHGWELLLDRAHADAERARGLVGGLTVELGKVNDELRQCREELARCREELAQYREETSALRERFSDS